MVAKDGEARMTLSGIHGIFTVNRSNLLEI